MMRLLHRLYAFTAVVVIAVSLMCVSSCQPAAVSGARQEGEYAVTVSIPVTKSKEAGTDVQSAVIYAFNATSGNLTGYLNTGAIPSDPDYDPTEGTYTYRFLMYLTEAGDTDFFVILNHTSDRFSFTYENGTPFIFGTSAPEGLTKGQLLYLKVSVNYYTDIHIDGVPLPSEDVYLPMTNFGAGGYDVESNRRYNVLTDGNTTVNLKVSRVVNKIEVWFRSNDYLKEDPSTPSTCMRIVSQTLNDPTTAYAPLFNYTVSNNGTYNSRNFADYNAITRDSETRKTSIDKEFDYNSFQNAAGVGFPEYTGQIYKGNSEYYSDDYFILIGEYYVLPNRRSDDDYSDSPSVAGARDATRLDITYGQDVGTYNAVTSSWQWLATGHTQTKTLYMPLRRRNTILKVWCDFDSGESFFYTVEDWDKKIIDVPAFE